jgi:hypothetical protein
MVVKPRKVFNFGEHFTFLAAFISFIGPIFKCKDLILRTVDIWTHNTGRLESHKMCFFVLVMEDLFTSRDKLVKVKYA